MLFRAIAIVLCMGTLAGAAACRHGPPTAETRIVPEAVAPGGTAVIQPPRLEAETKLEAVRVLVGQQPATVLNLAPEVGIAFLVPALEPGEVEVTVEIGGSTVGTTRLTVKPSPARHLVLTMTGDEIALVSDRGASGLAQPNREIPEGPALSYDVLSAEGVLVSTGVLSHPLHGRREIFGEDGTMRGAPVPDSATFTLRIQALPAGGSIRFYEAEPGADLSTETGRATRRQISTIEIGG